MKVKLSLTDQLSELLESRARRYEEEEEEFEELVRQLNEEKKR
jgi:hypothetical protein